MQKHEKNTKFHKSGKFSYFQFSKKGFSFERKLDFFVILYFLLKMCQFVKKRFFSWWEFI